MGPRGRRRHDLRRDLKQKKDDVWQQDSGTAGAKGIYTKAGFMTANDMKNDLFEEYYKAQEVVPEGEWDTFMACLRKPLPVTFRINGGGRFASALRDKLQSDFFSHLGSEQIMVEGEPMSPPRPLPWYPNNLAWHMNFSRGQLRKMPILGQIHEYLKHANEHGGISRQEAVSMIPPLFMDVASHHKILDMCAAPGSKTFQLLEGLHTGGPWGTGGGVPFGEVPTGFVIANDADFKRCSLLTHQLKRVCSPCLMVTNHSAEQFPSLSDGKSRLRFDRILCDVPCSGDGTLRKAPDIWARWTPNNGNALHPLQIRIAMQGCHLLAVGGLMVYSTCTFNPVEDEAVVAEVLLRCGGAVELMDVSEHMADLKRLPGRTDWRVCDVPKGRSGLHWYSSWDSAQQSRLARVEASMFPSDAKAALPLHRCMRFLPHHQDTGGFFVAVLKKVGELPANALQRNNKGPVAPARVARPDAANPSSDGGDAPAAAPASTSADVADDATDAAAALETRRASAFEAVRVAAADAVEAAGRGLDALEGEEAAKVREASRQASAAAERAARAQGRVEQADESLKAAAAAVAAAAARAESQPAAAAVNASDAGLADDDMAAAAMDDNAPTTAAPSAAPSVVMDDAEDAAAAAAADEELEDGEEAAGEGDEAGKDVEMAGLSGTALAASFSWIRGGGGRNRFGTADVGGATANRYHLGVDPVAPVEDPQVLSSVASFYGLPESLPLNQQLITRSLESSRPKRLYYVSRSILDLLLMDTHEQLKIAATGLKVFERQDDKDGSGCSYRLAMEGLPFLLPHVSKQRVTLPASVLLQFIKERTLDLPKQGTAVGADAVGDTDGTEADADATTSVPPVVPPAATASGKGHSVLQDASVVAQLRALHVGCCVVELARDEAVASGFSAASGSERDGSDGTGGGAVSAGAPLALVAWRGRASISIMVDKNQCGHIIERLEAAMRGASDAPVSSA